MVGCRCGNSVPICLVKQELNVCSYFCREKKKNKKIKYLLAAAPLGEARSEQPDCSQWKACSLHAIKSLMLLLWLAVKCLGDFSAFSV